MTDRQVVSWKIEGGVQISKDLNVPSITIKWNEGITQGKITAVNVKDMPLFVSTLITRTITIKAPFNPDDPNYTGPLLTLNASNKSPKQFDFITLNLTERYLAQPARVEWTIDGQTSTGDMSKSVYFPTVGNKNISAKIYFKETTETKSISISVNVSAGVPNLTTMSGGTKLGIGSQATYTVTQYAASDVEYIWEATPRNIIVSQSGNYLIASFSQAGTYSIKCQAKDKRTGAVGSKVSKSVFVSSDYGILSVDETLFSVVVNSNKQIEITLKSTDRSFVEESMPGFVPYYLCNMSLGTVVASGSIDCNRGNAFNISVLQKGLYVLYLELGSGKKETHKIFIK